jgi:carbamoyltransferase
VGNGRILKEKCFKQVWVQPASGDAGGALGAAFLIWHDYLGNKRSVDGKRDKQKGSFLGPSYSDEYIERFLLRENIPYKRLSYQDVPRITAGLIAQGNVIGWFEGASEFGPRALGARSILGDARDKGMQSRMNQKIKFRESFRPFAPTVLQEHAREWFELETGSPYMLFTVPLRESKRIHCNDGCLEGLDKLKEQRSLVPSITHVDFSARIQTINKDSHALYYGMISAFYEMTGCPLVINTSFNVRGEPLVCSPEDAYGCFLRTGMDYLVMGCFLLDKSRQQPAARDSRPADTYEPD